MIQSVLMAFPILNVFGATFYFLCEMLGLLNAYLFMALGIWRPVEHLHKHFERLDNFH